MPPPGFEPSFPANVDTCLRRRICGIVWTLCIPYNRRRFMVYLLSVGLGLFTEDEVSPSAWQITLISSVGRDTYINFYVTEFKLNLRKEFATNYKNIKNPRGHRRPSGRHHFTRVLAVGDADLKCDYMAVHPNDELTCNSWGVTFSGEHKISHFR
jgi:hypothetical protein